MTWTRRLCSKQFDQIPENAIAIGRKRRDGQLWMFDKSEVHDLKLDRPKLPSRNACNRWHKQRNIFKPGCRFCELDAAAAKPEITPTAVLVEIAKELLIELPQPQPELPIPEPVMAEFETEPEQSETTTLAYAFRNSKKL
jgi:hypothetical protein